MEIKSDWTSQNWIDAEDALDAATDTLTRIRWAVVLDTLAGI